MSRAFEGMRNRQEAQEYFRETAPGGGDAPTSELEAALRTRGIATVDLGLDPSTFQDLSDQYAVCIDEHPEPLDQTAGGFDIEGVPEDGHVRKEIQFNGAGMQISDPKSLFHFNNSVVEKVQATDMLNGAPRDFREFMTHGIDLHRTLAQRARSLVEILDASYGRMGELYFPEGHDLGKVTLRLLRYDGYPLFDESGKLIAKNGEQVAKGHYDRGGLTIQAYASAPGFWIHPEPKGGKRKPTTDADKIYPPHGIGKSQLFAGAGHRMIYGSNDNIRSLYHGVDRIIDEEAQDGYMPPRTAAITFVEMPRVDLGLTAKDTQPDRIDRDRLVA